MNSISERLDPFFESIGIEPQAMGMSGRKYNGVYKGRTLKADCSYRSRTRYAGPVRYRNYNGHRLNFTMGTPLKTRLILASAGTVAGGIAAFINRRSGMTLMEDLGPDFAHLTVWAHDPAWVRQLLAQPGALEMINHLLPPGELPPNIAVNLQPDQLLYSQRVALGKVTPGRARNWVTALENLLILAERSPAPGRVAELSWYEKQARKNPTLVGCVTLSLIFGAVIAAGFAFTGFLLLVSFLLSSIG